MASPISLRTCLLQLYGWKCVSWAVAEPKAFPTGCDGSVCPRSSGSQSQFCFTHTVPPGFIDLSACNWTEGLSSVMEREFYSVPVFWTVEHFMAELAKGFYAIGVMKHFTVKDNWVFIFSLENSVISLALGTKAMESSINDQNSGRPSTGDSVIMKSS